MRKKTTTSGQAYAAAHRYRSRHCSSSGRGKGGRRLEQRTSSSGDNDCRLPTTYPIASRAGRLERGGRVMRRQREFFSVQVACQIGEQVDRVHHLYRMGDEGAEGWGQ